MNNQTVPSVTLQTAVLMQVTEFAKNNQSFSIHDITDALRLKVNNGELEIPEVEEQGASFRFNIRHSNVRSIFREMLDTGVFDPQFSLEETFPNDKYFVYVPTLGVASTVAAPSVTQQFPSTTTTTVAPSAPVSTPPSPVAAPSVKPSREEITRRVKLYLNNCVVCNFRPSLKQVQSAIKRGAFSTGWTCEELEDIIVGDLNLSVIPNPDFASASQVAVV